MNKIIKKFFIVSCSNIYSNVSYARFAIPTIILSVIPTKILNYYIQQSDNDYLFIGFLLFWSLIFYIISNLGTENTSKESQIIQTRERNNELTRELYGQIEIRNDTEKKYRELKNKYQDLQRKNDALKIKLKGETGKD